MINNNILLVIMSQDLVSNDYGSFWTDKIVLNDLEAENIVKTDMIEELNTGQGITINNNLNVSGEIQCQNVISTSDIRIKRNIKDINKVKALNFIKRLKVKTYNFFNKRKPNIGLIAQDVEKEDNLFVDTSNNTMLNISNFKSVRYQDIHNLLIPTVQLLIRKVEEQERRINYLENNTCLCNYGNY